MSLLVSRRGAVSAARVVAAGSTGPTFRTGASATQDTTGTAVSVAIPNVVSGDTVLLGISTTNSATPTISSVSSDHGGTMTLVGTAPHGAGPFGTMFIYAVVANATATNTCTATLSTSIAFTAGGLAYSGVGPITDFSLSASPGSASGSSQSCAATVSGALSIQFWSSASGFSTVTGGTSRINTGKLAISENVASTSSAFSITTPFTQQSGANLVVNPTSVPLFSVAGAGIAGGIAFNQTGSFSTGTLAANSYVLFFLNSGSTAAYGADPSLSVSGAMTLLGTSVNLNNDSSKGQVRVYGIAVTPSGAQTLSFFPGFNIGVAGNTVAYTGVTSVATPTTSFGSGSALSRSSITVPTGGVVVHGFGVADAGASLSETLGSLSGGTSRFNTATTFAVMQVSDSASTTAFAATCSQSAVYWASDAVILT